LTSTDGAATAEPTDAVCDVALFAVKLAATSAVPVAVKTTGLPLSPVTVAETVLAPAVVPSVQEVSVAMPELFVVTVEPLAGDVVPLPAVVVNVTTIPEIGLLLASRTVTEGTSPAALISVPTVAVCDVVVPVVGTMFWLVAAVLVPVNVTVVIAVAVAVTVFAAPAVRPNVHVESEATPELFDATVATLVGLIDPAAAPEPPVAVSVKVTLKPLTGLPCASLTITDGAATAEPTVAVCDVALLAVNVVAVLAVPVALKTTGLPLKPEVAAWTVFAPAVVPSVHVVSAATPEASVVTVLPLTGDVVPLPAVVVKVTTTP
jgi:hypothetical protein